MTKTRKCGAAVEITRPIVLWNKPIQANMKDLVNALARGVTGVATMNKLEVVLAFDARPPPSCDHLDSATRNMEEFVREISTHRRDGCPRTPKPEHPRKRASSLE